MASSVRQRCAIYTRKSTEEGLDHTFNSLDAQREACAAYVLSQQHEGWVLLPELYDDGGFSGGNMDRPGLGRLLRDVKAGRVDVVVVYKIDRLTRSLADFAKIVEVLDAAQASFVSVTQAFNTTSSMGRLTLNVLLSFAQFEREVIAERIRDKVAASRKRGMWMGGPVALGYRVENRKLVVVPGEADTVRDIMERYVRSSSVRDLLVELTEAGIVSKRRVSKSGRVTGGVPFVRGALYALLSNRLYLGETAHKGAWYPGEHEAIVSPELFDAVQARLSERTNPRSPLCSRKRVSLLASMIFDRLGRPMSPYHTRNHGRRYSYYASNPGDGRREPAQRLPASQLDQAVRLRISSWLADSSRTRELANGHPTATLSAVIEECRNLGKELAGLQLPLAREQLQKLALEVRVDKDVRVSFDCGHVLKKLGLDSSPERVELLVPTEQATHGHEPRLRLEPPVGVTTPRDERLVELLTRAFAVRERLLSLSQDEVTAMPATTLRHLERVARLSYLEPGIVVAILDGKQPRSLSARKLSRMAALPLDWTAQRAALGFAAA